MMARKRRFSPAFALLMAAALLVLLLGLVLLFYGGATHGSPRPILPGQGHFAGMEGLHHG